MEQDIYEVNLETWASSLMQLEEDSLNIQTPKLASDIDMHSALVPTMPTYYRSKAFSSNIGINNLINAADPILTLVTKLRRIGTPPEVSVLHQNICHEIRAFETKAQTLGYRSQLIIAARYVICALLDEMIALTLWPEMEWKKYSLIELFHKEPWDSERFFLILERSLQDAAGHIDLLELTYLCLRFGYEGKYRKVERGHHELHQVTDHLYNTITHFRDESSRNLLISIDNTTLKTQKKKSYLHLLPPLWLISTIMVLSLIVTFIFLYSRILEASTPVSQFLNELILIQDKIESTNTAQI